MRSPRFGCTTFAVLVLCWAAAGVCRPAVAADGTAPRFGIEVQAVLSRAGCNQGTCHGNATGKGGLKLSLRGEDNAWDHAALVRHQYSRRVNLLDPAASLILQKATGQVAHEGGRRFEVDSLEYRTLIAWLRDGAPPELPATPRVVSLEVTPAEQVLLAPADRLPLEVVATLSDGTRRDVTWWSVYTPSNGDVSVSPDGVVHRERYGQSTIVVRYLNQHASVRVAFVPERPAFVWSAPPEANYIDRHVFARLQPLRMNPSELADDTTFLRRAYLDTLGLLPTADEARRFVADTRPDKRARLIDALLERPEFAEVWALRWSDLLRNEETTLDRKGVQNFHQWIRRSIADGKPMDQFVHELLTARGSTYTNPPTNFYRAQRDPITRAESAAQVFLGLRLQCAKCHNHPFDRWTQDDYYGWAAWFARVDYTIVDNQRSDRNNKHEFVGEQIVWMPRSGEVNDPRTGAPAPPRLLAAETPPLGRDDDRLEALAAWVVDKNNPRLARNLVNRIWYHLLGQGLVDPVDDFRDSNPPAIPALLDELAADFIAHGFDLRHAVRTIMNSRVYQLSAVPNETNADDEYNFSRARVRPLPAEVLLDALTQVTDSSVAYHGYPLGTRAGQLPGVRAFSVRQRAPTAAEQFLAEFGKPPRLLACECERAGDLTLNQAFQLISGPVLNRLISDTDNRLSRLLEQSADAAAVVDELFWICLNRPPNSAEQAAATAHLDGAANRRAAAEDLLWGLLNSKEFLLRR